MRQMMAGLVSLITLPFRPTTGALVVTAWVMGAYVLVTLAVDTLSQGRTWLTATSFPLVIIAAGLVVTDAVRKRSR